MTSPLDLNYMKLVRFSFSLIDFWPHREMKTKNPVPLANNKFLFCLILFVVVAELIYMKNNVGVLSFLVLGHTYITGLITFLCLFRLTLPWIKGYRQLIIDFIENIHVFHYKDESEYSMKTYNKIYNFSVCFTIFLHVQMYSGVLLFNITPLHNNIRAGLLKEKVSPNDTIDIELSIYYDLPFDSQTNLTAYFLVFIFNLYVSLINTLVLCINELFISLIAIHLWGHFKILEYNLINFPKPKITIKTNSTLIGEKNISYSEEESIMVKKLLIENVNRHRMATNFLSKSVNVFGPTMCLYYAFQQISECIILCEICKLEAEALGKYGILTLVLFQQLIEISVVYEIMSSMASTLTQYITYESNGKIINAVYSLPWECMTLENQKLVLFFLKNVQVPFNLKALSMVPIGAQTMVAILKTSFSYFIMLRAIAYD
nr:odorant receptor 15 [Papilio glaucus]